MYFVCNGKVSYVPKSHAMQGAEWLQCKLKWDYMKYVATGVPSELPAGHIIMGFDENVGRGNNSGLR